MSVRSSHRLVIQIRGAPERFSTIALQGLHDRIRSITLDMDAVAHMSCICCHHSKCARLLLLHSMVQCTLQLFPAHLLQLKAQVPSCFFPLSITHIGCYVYKGLHMADTLVCVWATQRIFQPGTSQWVTFFKTADSPVTRMQPPARAHSSPPSSQLTASPAGRPVSMTVHLRTAPKESDKQLLADPRRASAMATPRCVCLSPRQRLGREP